MLIGALLLAVIIIAVIIYQLRDEIDYQEWKRRNK